MDAVDANEICPMVWVRASKTTRRHTQCLLKGRGVPFAYRDVAHVKSGDGRRALIQNILVEPGKSSCRGIVKLSHVVHWSYRSKVKRIAWGLEGDLL